MKFTALILAITVFTGPVSATILPAGALATDNEPLLGDEDIVDFADNKLTQAELNAQAEELNEILSGEVIPVGSGSLLVKVCKSCRPQSMSLHLNGKTVMSGIKISTANPKLGKTPSGKFTPGEIARKRKSNFATKKYGRPIYLEYAIQVVGGVFLHAASHAAQKNTLGNPASNGCIRVDRSKIAQVFNLISSHRKTTVIHIH